MARSFSPAPFDDFTRITDLAREGPALQAYTPLSDEVARNIRKLPSESMARCLPFLETFVGTNLMRERL